MSDLTVAALNLPLLSTATYGFNIVQCCPTLSQSVFIDLRLIDVTLDFKEKCLVKTASSINHILSEMHTHENMR